MTNTESTQIREGATRQAGWFNVASGVRNGYHYTTTGGATATCNKGFGARYAPLNGTGNKTWGFQISSDEEMAAKMAEYDFLKQCPKCTAKREAAGL